MIDLATLGVKVTNSGIEETSRKLGGLSGTAGKTEKSLDSVSAASDKASKGAKRLTSSISSLGVVMGALGIGAAASGLISATDKMASYRGQLALVTDSQEQLNATYDRALALANATGQSTDATINLYARLARSTEQLGVNQNQLFTVTEMINKAFIVSGASAQESAAAILQLSQGMASGVLRGEELNSVMENGPRLARALADGLGVTIGELRELGKAGELTTEVVFAALERMSRGVSADFDKMPISIGRAMQEIRNLMGDAFGSIDVSPVIASIKFLSENFDVLAKALGVAAVAAVAHFIPAVWASVTAFGAATAQSAAYQLALARMAGLSRTAAIAQTALGTATAGASRAMMILGGPWGIVLTAAAAFFAFSGRAKEAAVDIEALDQKIDQLRGSTDNLSMSQRKYMKLLEQQKLSALTASYAKVSKELKALNSLQDYQIKNASKHYVAQVRLRAELDDTAQEIENQRDILADLNEVTSASVVVTEAAQTRLEKLQGTYSDTEEIINEMRSATTDYIGDLEYKIRLLGMSERQQAIENAVRAAGVKVTKDEIIAIRDLAGELYDKTEAMRAAKGATEGFTTDLGSGIEGLGITWDSMWSSALNGFDGFADMLKRGLYDLLGDLTQQLARPLLVKFGGSFGESIAGNVGGSVAGTGVSVAGGAAGTGGVGGASSAAGAGSLGGMSGAALGGLAFAVYGIMRQSDDIDNGLYGYGDVLSGNYFDVKYKDKFNDVLPGLGSAGAELINGLHGNPFGIFDGVFESIFGGAKKPSNHGARAEVDLASGYRASTGRQEDDDKFSPENFAAVETAATMLERFAALTGGTGTYDIHQGDRKGVRLNGEQFASMADAVAAAFDEILLSAEDLDPRLRALITGFQGTAEQTLAFSEGVASLETAIKTNPVAEAVADFERQQTAAGRSLMDNYRAQERHLNTLIANYDGSALAVTDLNTAMQTTRGLAYNMAIAIEQVGIAIDGATKDASTYFGNASKSPNQIRAGQFEEREGLIKQLHHSNSPDTVATLVEQINALSRSIFDSYDSNKQAELGTAYATFTENIGAVAQSRLDLVGANLETAGDNINVAVNNLLDNSVVWQNSADTILSAAEILGKLADEGINVNVNTTTGEAEVAL